MIKKTEKTSSLPSSYKEGVPRASSLVEFFFPFKGTPAYGQFVKWLRKEGLDHDWYMDTANSWWTKIHEAMEDWIGGKLLIGSKVPFKILGHILRWTTRLEALKPDTIKSELYLLEKENRFQWTADLLYTKDKKTILRDWKSFWVRKLRYNLSPWKLAVEKKKREKVWLQMSLYAFILEQQGTKIDEIELLYIHKYWIRSYKEKPFSKEKVEKMLWEFELANPWEEDLFF